IPRNSTVLARLLDDLILQLPIARAEQGAQNAGRIDRLPEARHIPISLGDRPLLVSCREDERYAARPKSVGNRIDHVPAQVDIENCRIKAAAMLHHLQRLLDAACWPYRFHPE